VDNAFGSRLMMWGWISGLGHNDAGRQAAISAHQICQSQAAHTA
jgi:hypothetical protein